MTQEDLKAALEEGLKREIEHAEEELAAVYRKLWPLRKRYAEMFQPAELPKARYRTDKQNLVARCPRCGGRLESEGAAPK